MLDAQAGLDIEAPEQESGFPPGRDVEPVDRGVTVDLIEDVALVAEAGLEVREMTALCIDATLNVAPRVIAPEIDAQAAGVGRARKRFDDLVHPARELELVAAEPRHDTQREWAPLTIVGHRD